MIPFLSVIVFVIVLVLVVRRVKLVMDDVRRSRPTHQLQQVGENLSQMTQGQRDDLIIGLFADDTDPRRTPEALRASLEETRREGKEDLEWQRIMAMSESEARAYLRKGRKELRRQERKELRRPS